MSRRHLVLAITLVGCAEQHLGETDAPIVIDPLAELGPRCPMLPTPCFVASHDGDLSSTGEYIGLDVLSVDVFDERTEVLVRRNDYMIEEVRFLLVRSVPGMTATTVIGTGDTFSSTGGGLLSYADHTSVAWDICHATLVPGRCDTWETLRAQVSLAGEVGPTLTTSSSTRSGRALGSFLRWGTDEVVFHSLHGEVELDYADDRPDSTVAWTGASEATNVVRQSALSERRWIGMTAHAVRRMPTRHEWGVFREAEAVVPATTIPAPHFSFHELTVLDDEIWLVGMEVLEEDLAHNRLRVTRRRASDLGRIEPDRWVDGWGGLTPVVARVLPFGGVPWLIWITPDARYDQLVLHALPLDGPACGRAVDMAAWVTPFGSDARVNLVSTDNRITLVTHSGSGLDFTSLRACD